eukprot:gene994-1866_t
MLGLLMNATGTPPPVPPNTQVAPSQPQTKTTRQSKPQLDMEHPLDHNKAIDSRCPKLTPDQLVYRLALRCGSEALSKRHSATQLSRMGHFHVNKACWVSLCTFWTEKKLMTADGDTFLMTKTGVSHSLQVVPLTLAELSTLRLEVGDSHATSTVLAYSKDPTQQLTQLHNLVATKEQSPLNLVATKEKSPLNLVAEGNASPGSGTPPDDSSDEDDGHVASVATLVQRADRYWEKGTGAWFLKHDSDGNWIMKRAPKGAQWEGSLSMLLREAKTPLQLSKFVGGVMLILDREAKRTQKPKPKSTKVAKTKRKSAADAKVREALDKLQGLVESGNIDPDAEKTEVEHTQEKAEDPASVYSPKSTESPNPTTTTPNPEPKPTPTTPTPDPKPTTTTPMPDTTTPLPEPTTTPTLEPTTVARAIERKRQGRRKRNRGRLPKSTLQSTHRHHVSNLDYWALPLLARGAGRIAGNKAIRDSLKLPPSTLLGHALRLQRENG